MFYFNIYIKNYVNTKYLLYQRNKRKKKKSNSTKQNVTKYCLQGENQLFFFVICLIVSYSILMKMKPFSQESEENFRRSVHNA